MDSMKNQSEVARFKCQISREYEAARQGLVGLACVASHETITARMTKHAEYILGLIRAGRDEEAQALLFTESWGIEELP